MSRVTYHNASEGQGCGARERKVDGEVTGWLGGEGG